MKETTHWDCGDEILSSFQIGGLIRSLVDDQVHQALIEYTKDIDLQFDEPDELFAYVCDSRLNQRGQAEAIGKRFIFSKEILLRVGDSVFDDGAIHPEDAERTLKWADVLDSISKELRRRVDVAKSVEANHQWSLD